MNKTQWTEFKGYIFGEPGAVMFAAAMFFAIMVTLAMFLYRTSRPSYKANKPPAGFQMRGMFANIIFIFTVIRIAGIWVATSKIIYWGLGVGLISDQIGVFATRGGSILSKLVGRRLDKLEEKVDDVKEEVVNVKNTVETTAQDLGKKIDDK